MAATGSKRINKTERMEIHHNYIEDEIFGNPVGAYLWCFGILLLGFILKRIIARFLSKQSFRMFKRFAENKYSEEFVELLRRPFEQLLVLLILFFAFDRLEFPHSWELVESDTYGIRWLIKKVYGIALLVVIVRIVLRVTDFLAFVISNREGNTSSRELAGFLKELIKVVLVILGFFTGLRVIFQVNITAVVASLGIGGLAVALAAQDTLANLLGSFIIYLDKPFKVGDQIEAGEIKGTVEHVGFRTTKVRTVEKTLMTVPNKKLIDSLLNNISMGEMRRVRFNITLTYKSKPEQIRSIINDIKQIIKDHPQTTDDFVVRFTDFDSSSLNILVVYFVRGNAYENMVNTKEELNMMILDIVERHGCEFAYPTQTVYIEQ